jgi:hypothetical protein
VKLELVAQRARAVLRERGASDDVASAAPPSLIVVENWIQEVEQRIHGG